MVYSWWGLTDPYHVSLSEILLLLSTFLAIFPPPRFYYTDALSPIFFNITKHTLSFPGDDSLELFIAFLISSIVNGSSIIQSTSSFLSNIPGLIFHSLLLLSSFDRFSKLWISLSLLNHKTAVQSYPQPLFIE